MTPLKDYQLDALKNTYPKGTRVKLIHMDDPYTHISPGTLGTVTCIDSLGTVFVNWDNGSSLGVVYGIDKITKAHNE